MVDLTFYIKLMVMSAACVVTATAKASLGIKPL